MINEGLRRLQQSGIDNVIQNDWTTDIGKFNKETVETFSLAFKHVGPAIFLYFSMVAFSGLIFVAEALLKTSHKNGGIKL